MGHAYRAVQWNRQKIAYDILLLASVVAYLWLFQAFFKTTVLWFGGDLGAFIDNKAIAIRAYATAAFLLLHVILSIGPLSRLSPKFLPLLYNRRHMGVTMFLLALNHARLALDRYHDLGDVKPLVSLFGGNLHYLSFIRFPFQTLGAAALVILFLMAATSHDFWLANLTAPIWKALHMGVYLAYTLIVLHVILGALQTHTSPLLAIAVAVGLLWIVGIHLAAAWKEAKIDTTSLFQEDGFVDACSASDIPENRACIVTIAEERVAIFKYDGKISALSNVCQHQNGPLGEGKIVDGCVTCPWHGYQYLPESGASPPPFAERVPTFDVKLKGDRVWVSITPNPPGATAEPAAIDRQEV